MPPVLDVDVRQTPQGTVVRLHGELDMGSVPVLRNALARQRGTVVLDLRDLTFIDLAGLQLLLDADARARQDGLDLAVVPGRVVDRLLELTGVRARFCIRERP